jgi:hypothetical protein
MNARMYAVTPEVERGWQELLGRVADDAGVPLSYLPYPAPQPLEALWARPDLGLRSCAVTRSRCGSRRSRRSPPRYQRPPGRRGAVYRTDLIVRQDSAYRRLEDTFGGRAGYTVAHSIRGLNAFRHHLLRYRTPQRPVLYGEMLGNSLRRATFLTACAPDASMWGPRCLIGAC